MVTNTTNIKSCIFCRIVKGEIPSYKIYDDKNFFGFLDISPRGKGHALLIPKKHYRWVYDVPNFDEYWLAALSVTNALKVIVKPLFFSYFTYGLDVPHAHIHILPRYNKGGIIPGVIKQNEEEVKRLASEIFTLTQKGV